MESVIILKIKGFRTAVVDNICGGRTTNRFLLTTI
jgi:hypothetical protein